jgi:bacteriocin-like protein
MNKKSLMSQMVNLDNYLTIKDLPAELVELSEKDLQQVVGGRDPIITISLDPSPGPYSPYRLNQ